jgi:hypothetical protein
MLIRSLALIETVGIPSPPAPFDATCVSPDVYKSCASRISTQAAIRTIPVKPAREIGPEQASEPGDALAGGKPISNKLATRRPPLSIPNAPAQISNGM